MPLTIFNEPLACLKFEELLLYYPKGLGVPALIYSVILICDEFGTWIGSIDFLQHVAVNLVFLVKPLKIVCTDSRFREKRKNR